MALTYVADYTDELRSVGELQFSVRLKHPVLIVQGIAGSLKDSGTAGSSTHTLVSVEEVDEARQASRLIGRVFQLRKGEGIPPGPITVGRTADNDVAIPEYSISKRHCMFRLQGREVHVMDCGSTNGTLMNGAPLVAKRPIPIAAGSTLVLGRFAFLFQTGPGFLKMLRESS